MTVVSSSKEHLSLGNNYLFSLGNLIFSIPYIYISKGRISIDLTTRLSWDKNSLTVLFLNFGFRWSNTK